MGHHKIVHKWRMNQGTNMYMYIHTCHSFNHKLWVTTKSYYYGLMGIASEDKHVHVYPCHS